MPGLAPGALFQEIRMTKHALSENDLDQFTGTEHWYRHPLVRSLTYTDGSPIRRRARRRLLVTRHHRHSPTVRRSRQNGAISGLDAQGPRQSEGHGHL